MSLIAIDKWKRLFRMIKQHGGIRSSLSKIWRMDTLKEGKLVGCDAHGNRYFTNDYYLIGRNRWVEFNPAVKFEYDASQIHPDWYGWLHHKTDLLPCEDPAKMEIACCGWYNSWLMPHEENWSGSPMAYQPYSTTPARIHCWDAPAVAYVAPGCYQYSGALGASELLGGVANGAWRPLRPCARVHCTPCTIGGCVGDHSNFHGACPPPPCTTTF